MKVTTSAQTSRRLAQQPNHMLVQILKATVARLHNLEMELNELELASDDDQEEIEGYTHEIDKCRDRMKDIDEFVRPLRSGEILTMPDMASVLINLIEDREEEENAIRQYTEARWWHEQQFENLQRQCAVLKQERVILHKTCIKICSIFRRNGFFKLIQRRLTKLNSKLA
ncbi:hypothetical protein PHMEG_00019423 [Phytophthora megakarya]|uniref:Uncharacterized protein n=1 Tax=Phytophthora megakarya TaxID=4795 RepID=A0A225VU57_9STRA|nr:hypothetical protein PHMEG_00019423 [Phytophthora megakarya]